MPCPMRKTDEGLVVGGSIPKKEEPKTIEPKVVEPTVEAIKEEPKKVAKPLKNKAKKK